MTADSVDSEEIGAPISSGLMVFEFLENLSQEEIADFLSEGVDFSFRNTPTALATPSQVRRDPVALVKPSVRRMSQSS